VTAVILGTPGQQVSSETNQLIKEPPTTLAMATAPATTSAQTQQPQTATPKGDQIDAEHR
jgi:hypothetical protein